MFNTTSTKRLLTSRSSTTTASDTSGNGSRKKPSSTAAFVYLDRDEKHLPQQQIMTTSQAMIRTSANKLATGQTSQSNISNHSNNSKSRLLNDLLSGNKCSAVQAVGTAIDSLCHFDMKSNDLTIKTLLQNASGVDSVVSDSDTSSAQALPHIQVVTASGSQDSSGAPSTSSTSQSSSQMNSTNNLWMPAAEVNQQRSSIVHCAEKTGECVYGGVNARVLLLPTSNQVTNRMQMNKLNSSNGPSPLNMSAGLRSSIFRPKEVEVKHETSV